MAVQYYAREDIQPLVVSVASMTMFYVTHVSFKVAVEKEFPDLKGLISTDVLDRPALEMLETMEENEWSSLISECILSIQDGISRLSDHYNLDWRKEFKCPRALELSTGFLMKIGFYVDEDNFENHWSELERITRFCSYVYYMLCRVLLYEQVDFDVYYDGYDIDGALPYMEDLVRMGNEEEYDVVLLGLMGVEMLGYYVRLVELESKTS